MKRFTNVPTTSKKITVPLKYLVVAVVSMMAVPISQADVTGKKIGDLEIYKPAQAGKTTITMMLDTSGSMTINQVETACDLPDKSNFSAVGAEWSNTNPQYIRNFCSYKARYFYRLDVKDKNKWYRCGGSNGLGSSNYSFNDCNTSLKNAPSVAGYDYITSSSGNQYYFTGEKVYDRLTRLKDAIFTLMDSTQLDPKKVAIGLGQYSSHSSEDNKVVIDSDGTVQKSADGRTGKILIPAALLDDIQRQKIREAVAAAGGGQGTPTANAYAEVGAYMLGTNTSGGTYSGFSKSTTASKAGGNYISPLLKPSSCDGRGIYFLTDGAPNNSPNPLALMRLALKRSDFNTSKGALPVGSDTNNSGMPEVGAFAKALRDSTMSPLGTDQEIYTAVVGFGADFDVDREEDAKKKEKDRVIRNLPYTNPKTGVTKDRDFYNCANIVGKDSDATKDAKNACNWGEKSHPSLPGVGGFGEGGFYSAQSTDDIVNSIISFVTDLDNTLPSTPSGTIIIPDDPYRADSQLAVAYYPTLQPKVGDNSVVWEGNLKKYKLNEGTLFGKGDVKLFKSIAGELNPAAPDLWSDKSYAGANDKVENGGFYAQLNTPATKLSSVRTLYVEDWTNATDKKPVLRKFGVNDAGKVVVDGLALTSTTFKDTATYNEATLRKLLNFLGFKNLQSTSIAVKDMTLNSTNTPESIKVLGATIHSTPAAVSYSAMLDATTGRVTDTRDDYVLFGSSEGGLHLVDADNEGTGDGGKEKFVIIPREMLRDPSKSDALIKGATKAEIGVPNFGIDAPWLVTADYQYNLSNNRVNVNTTGGKGVFAYGGLRMGGEAFYGVNLNDSDNPSMMFTITPQTLGFSRMGQIWEKPTKAKIKTSTTDTGTDVLVFGGGYDMCYENESFQVGVNDSLLGSCSNKASAQGNAVYIINARTGALIWSASNVANSTGASNTVPAMTNSVVAGVTTLDRDNDGFMDHIYFADLGGQIFRADFTNAGFNKPVMTGTPSPETSFTNTRVTRILQSAYTGNDKKYNYRFYERPVISFYRNDSTNTLFALVNAISGDRSSPLSKIRDNTKADRLYGIIDSDVTKLDNVFYASNFTTAGTAGGQVINDLADSNLAELPSAIGTLNSTGYTLAQKNGTIDTLKNGTKKGWYYPLTRFDGYGNVRYSKGIGKSEVIDSFIYTTVYNPDMSYGATDSCSAKVTGGSERQLYCLPYGICTDDASKNGTAGYVRAGKGIQELTLGPRSSNLSNQRLLIGTRTLTERANDRVNFGSDDGKFTYDTPLLGGGKKEQGLQQNLTAADQVIGDGTAPDMIFNERYTLQPKTWYEVD